MRYHIRYAAIVAASLLASTLAASAQGQTDKSGKAMGSEKVGNGSPTTKTPGQTSGSNMGANGANHPTPSSTQGDVGPAGNNNGTRTSPSK